jgi:hypothetical protein
MDQNKDIYKDILKERKRTLTQNYLTYSQNDLESLLSSIYEAFTFIKATHINITHS